MDVKFQKLGEREFDGVKLVALESWIFAYEKIFSCDYIERTIEEKYSTESLHQFLPKLKTGRMFFEVAFQEDCVVGFCCCFCPYDGIELSRLYIHPKQIGRGIGTEFLGRVEDYAKEQGVTKCYCYVYKENKRAIQFYLGKGFRYSSVQDKADEWRMEKIYTKHKVPLPLTIRRLMKRR